MDTEKEKEGIEQFKEQFKEELENKKTISFDGKGRALEDIKYALKAIEEIIRAHRKDEKEVYELKLTNLDFDDIPEYKPLVLKILTFAFQKNIEFDQETHIEAINEDEQYISGLERENKGNNIRQGDLENNNKCIENVRRTIKEEKEKVFNSLKTSSLSETNKKRKKSRSIRP